MHAVAQIQPFTTPQAIADERESGSAFRAMPASAQQALMVWGVVLAALLLGIAVAAAATVYAWPAVA